MISCLCVTHDRHEFMPWVEHQFLKQRAGSGAEFVILDSSSKPWASDVGRVLHVPCWTGISKKRTGAMDASAGRFITWFDDDDWQSPGKLQGAESQVSAIGARHAYMYSIQSGQAALYESTYEPIIFNSAVYRKNSVPQNFDSTRVTGEDTEWCERWLKTRPTFVTLGEPTHAWLCHGKNIVNKASSRFFDMPNPIPFDDWELEFLERMRAGKI